MATKGRTTTPAVAKDAAPAAPRKLTGAELQAARAAARERYAAIAEALKLEAGVTRHYEHKEISGLAFTSEGKILAPAGVTRRQLYVLAHECGHMVLHSAPHTRTKPSHVKEHEAETYAHRAFARYGIEVPDASARWARAYVGQWIMKDRAAGVPICRLAEAFAAGERCPLEPLASVDGSPQRDFSRQIERFIARGTRTVARLEQAEPPQQRAEQSAQSEQSRQTVTVVLTEHERALLKKLLRRVDQLERWHVRGANEAAANTLELIERRASEGQSTLPVVLRGLETLQRLAAEHRRARRRRLHDGLVDSEAFGFALWFLVFAAGGFLAGWAVSEIFHYVGGFFVAIAAAIVAYGLAKAHLSE